MGSVFEIIKTSRPAGWVILPALFSIGAKFAGTPVNYLILFYLSFPFSLLGYGMNDLYDYKTDRLNPRKKVSEILHKKKSFLRNAILLANIPILLYITYTAETLTAALLWMLVTGVCLYSAPPVRLKEKPPLDSLSNGVSYLLLPTMLGYSLSGTLAGYPTRLYWIALCVAGIHAVGAIQDIVPDKKAGQRTIATAFGGRTAALFAFSAFALAIIFGRGFSPVTIAYLYYCAAISAAIAINKKFARTGFSLIFAGFLVTMALLILG